MNYNDENPSQDRIIGYCSYCKDPVYDYEDFEYLECTYFHNFCYEVLENENLVWEYLTGMDTSE